MNRRSLEFLIHRKLLAHGWMVRRLKPSERSDPDAPILQVQVGDRSQQAAFLKLASFFTPQRVAGVRKTRAGSDFDGGYVMLDDFAEIALCLSLGIGENAEWDLAMAARGLPVEQYDPTIETPPSANNLIRFFRTRIVPSERDGGITIHSILERAGVQRKASAILKIDIENDEWNVLDQCSAADLRKFSQILVEFHDFSQARDAAWLRLATRVMEKLTAGFAVYHVHGNNWEPMIVTGNVYFPHTLEVSFANRERYVVAPTDELFPTELDRPNHPLRPDLYLGAFRYAPLKR